MDASLSPQILANHLSPADPVADASFLAAHAADSTGAAVSTVDGAASAAAFDGTAPADDSRLPASPLTDVAEGTVTLIAGSAADSTDAAATADDAGAPPTDAAEGTVPPVAEAAVNATVPSSEAGALAVPPTDVVGKTVPPVAGAAAGTDVDAAPADDVGASATAFETQRGKHWCRAPLQSQVVKGGSCRAPRHLLTYGFSVTVALVVRVVALVGRDGKHWTYLGAGEQSHRRETSSAAAVAAWHRRKTSIVVAAAAAEACHRREMPYCYPFVRLRLQRPPRPDNHDRRQEHGGAMDVPGTGGG